jgi:uncharacterized MAPEG superfamily protein
VYILILCLFIACFLPYLAKIPVAFAMSKQPGGYDNHHPRAQQAALTGLGARAAAGHQNSFESLIIFSTAILTALSTQHTTQTIQWLAILYLITRVIYHALYLLNWATMRSVIWGVSFLISVSIIWLCLP